MFLDFLDHENCVPTSLVCAHASKITMHVCYSIISHSNFTSWLTLLQNIRWTKAQVFISNLKTFINYHPTHKHVSSAIDYWENIDPPWGPSEFGAKLYKFSWYLEIQRLLHCKHHQHEDYVNSGLQQVVQLQLHRKLHTRSNITSILAGFLVIWKISISFSILTIYIVAPDFHLPP